MNKFNNFLHFFESNKNLIFKDEIRPTKSITRNIITGVSPFIEYYKKNKKLSLTGKEISRNILKLNGDWTSTTVDNIRNLEELKFLTKVSGKQVYKFTHNFIEFISSGLTLNEYIIQKLKKIQSISDITMFYNCILCLLHEGLKYGYIVNYPDSFLKFSKKATKKTDRVELCKKVYELYGFSGLKDVDFGDYTPNAIYRFASTCKSLKLIKNDKTDKYGFTKFIITQSGYDLLESLDNNFAKEAIEQKEIIKEEKTKTVSNETKPDAYTFEDIYDPLYLAESNVTIADDVLDYIDAPLLLANSVQVSNKRDPKKAANAKKKAGYKCEYDNNHQMFKGINGDNYCEAHHLVSMGMQSKFFYSLDVEANIICLCPNCHKLLHHSSPEEKRIILTKLYNDRIERLKNCNIYIELEDLIKYYSNC